MSIMSDMLTLHCYTSDQHSAKHKISQKTSPFSRAAFRASASCFFFSLKAASSSVSSFLSFLGACNHCFSIITPSASSRITLRGLSFPPCLLDIFVVVVSDQPWAVLIWAFVYLSPDINTPFIVNSIPAKTNTFLPILIPSRDGSVAGRLESRTRLRVGCEYQRCYYSNHLHFVQVLGPFPIHAREQHFISPSFPLNCNESSQASQCLAHCDRASVSESIDYRRRWPSSYADGGTVGWSKATISPDGFLDISFPDIR